MNKIFDTLAGVYEGDHTTTDYTKWRDVTASAKKAEDVYKRRLCGASLLLLALTGVLYGLAGGNIIPLWSLGITIPLGVVPLIMWPVGYCSDADYSFFRYSKEYTNIMSDDFIHYDTSFEACQVARNRLEDITTMQELYLFLECKNHAWKYRAPKNRSLGPLVRNGVITPAQALEILDLHSRYREELNTLSRQSAALEKQSTDIQSKKAEILTRHHNETTLLARIGPNTDKENYLSHNETLRKLKTDKQKNQQQQREFQNKFDAEWRAFKLKHNWGGAKQLVVSSSSTSRA